MTKPYELAKAEYVIGLCDRWKKLPSEILAEPVEYTVRMVQMYERGRPRQDADEVMYDA